MTKHQGRSPMNKKHIKFRVGEWAAQRAEVAYCPSSGAYFSGIASASHARRLWIVAARGSVLGHLLRLVRLER